MHQQASLQILKLRMGNYKAVHKYTDNQKMPRMYPEPDYPIKTRAPVNTGNTWRINMLLRIREQQLSDQAMPLARRKCFDPIIQFAHCQHRQGFFWYVFNCQQDFHYVSECLQHEYNVEMDKLRRNLHRNPEHWWKEFYDQNGEVGKQKEMVDQELNLLDSIKLTIFGDDKLFK